MEEIDELQASIAQRGLIQPIIIRPVRDRFETVAGARRLEACKRLRWRRIPCIIRDLDDRKAFEISLIENVQRQTLNVFEEGEAFRRYVERNGWGSETELARKIGKSQEYVSKRLSLLRLPNEIRQEVIRHRISSSAAEELVRLDDASNQKMLSDAIIEYKLPLKKVREASRIIRNGDYGGLATQHQVQPDQVFSQLDRQLQETITPEFNLNYLARASSIQIVKDLDKAILIFKLMFSRLGHLIDEINVKEIVAEVLLEKRVQVHQIMDSLIKLRSEFARETVHYTK